MKKRFVLYIIIILSIAGTFLCFKKDNIFRWIEASITVRRQQKQIELYREQIKQLEDRTTDLTTNRDSLEKFARETYNFSAPGEDVYLLDN